MSATEIIEQIKKLPSEEQQKVALFIHNAEEVGTIPKQSQKIAEDFKRLADEVFTTNAELFHKLAQ